MEPEIEDTCSEIWQARKCKSGEVIYYHNPVNGQDRWTISEVCADEQTARPPLFKIEESCPDPAAASSVPSYLPVERPTLVKAEHDDGAQGLSPSKASRNDLLSITDHLPTIQDQGMVGLQTDDIPKSTQRQLTCGKGKTGENNRKDYVCTVCGRPYSLLPSLRQHMRRVHKLTLSQAKQLGCCTESRISELSARLFTCDKCRRTFKTEEIMTSHRRVHEFKKPYTCGQCGKTFSQSSGLVVHLRVHSGEKPFSCETCEKSFIDQSTLATHRSVHTGERPFSCTYCQAKYNSRSTLKRHIRYHTGEKPFQCTQCKKRFASNHDLKRHMQTHTDEKPVHCSKCKKAFKDGNNLRRHMILHTGEKPFKCEECEKAFSDRSSLRTHRFKHTGEKPYKCKHCHGIFKYGYELSKHLLKYHN